MQDKNYTILFAGDIKDNYTKSHSERVTKYSIEIARAMGINRDKLEIIELACQLHDLGKIGVHDNILTKPDKLTKEEWEEIKLHPTKGVEILKSLTFLNEVMELIEQHHERYDGMGYPYGFNGEDIKLGARIMAVADSFDAMTSNRPYAQALSMTDAIEELKRCAGNQFDPKVVDVLIRLIYDNPDIFSK